MLTLRILILSVLFLLSGPALSSPPSQRLVQENRLLRSEYQLTKSSTFYLFFNLVEDRIQLKFRGFLLKDLPIKNYKIMGAPIPIRALSIKKKASFFKPKQIRIKPQKNMEEYDSEIPALEVNDMPSRYRLDLDGGVHLYIRPIYKNRILNLLNLFSSLKTYGVTLPMGTLLGVLKNETYTEVNLYLALEDAKTLFWVVREGLPCLIFSP